MNSGPLTLQDVANIVTFIAPGYFALQVYSLIYAKKERDFSRLFIESIVYSLPIVTFTSLIWQKVLNQPQVSSLDSQYAILLIGLALFSGVLFTFLRGHWPVRTIARLCGLGSPNDDFIKAQLLRLDVRDARKSSVTVTLKNGDVFSGTIDQLSRYGHQGPQYFYFGNLAWYDTANNDWEEHEGGLIIERSEIGYIETPRLRGSPPAKLPSPRKAE